jgi:sugar O-acyltransferase (sialic acid O-acetyltransferase NeuD family)
MGSFIMHKHLVIIGSGGHGQAVAELAMLTGKWDDVSFLDDCYPQKKRALNLPIIGNISSLFSGEHQFNSCFVAIGNNHIRKNIIEKIMSYNFELATLIHPNAWVSAHTIIKDGSAIMAGSVIGTNAKLGIGSVVNANSTVDHDCVLADFSHIGVGVHLAGGVQVGENSWLQTGCCAGYNVTVNGGETYLPGTIFK